MNKILHLITCLLICSAMLFMDCGKKITEPETIKTTDIIQEVKIGNNIGYFVEGDFPPSGDAEKPSLNGSAQIVKGGSLMLQLSTGLSSRQVLCRLAEVKNTYLDLGIGSDVKIEKGYFVIDLPENPTLHTKAENETFGNTISKTSKKTKYTHSMEISSAHRSQNYYLYISTKGSEKYSELKMVFEVVTDNNISKPAEYSVTVNNFASSSNFLQVSLNWPDLVDIDLHVQTPDGRDIYYIERVGQNGGMLDLDSNPDCEYDYVNNENITWFGNPPPLGKYVVRTDLWSACEKPGPFPFYLTINLFGKMKNFVGYFNAYEQTFGEAYSGRIITSFIITDDGKSDWDEDKKIKVNKITAVSNEAENGSALFEGHTIHNFTPTNWQFPGKALVIFHSTVLSNIYDPFNSVRPFEISLEAELLLENVNPNELNGIWAFAETPPYSTTHTITKKSYNIATVNNLRTGGIYKIEYKPDPSVSSSFANIVLPLAGCEVKEIIRNDLARARVFVERVKARYGDNPALILPHLTGFFWSSSAGDYVGRPEAADPKLQTVRKYNQIADNGQHPGINSVVTWFGVPILSSKLNNFMVGYALANFGYADWILNIANYAPFDWMQDEASTLSFDAGVKVARGAMAYDDLGILVKELYSKDTSDKHKKLWPNLSSPANFVAHRYDSGGNLIWGSVYDINNSFSSPGFLDPFFPLKW